MINKIKIVYLLGIGGIGMSALARYFNHLGCKVSGYDKTSTTLTDALVNEGIKIHFEDDVNLIPEEVKNNSEEVLIIYTPAIPKDHAEYNYFLKSNRKIYKRSQVLGQITSGSHSIAVAGTHGKTTTSTMIAHILTSSGIKTNAFLGGISGNYNTNLLLKENAVTTVLEADEYDRSFLQLHPDLAVITSMDPDHLDIYGNEMEMVNCYNSFANQIKSNGVLIHKVGLPVKTNARTLTYGLSSDANYYASNIRIENGKYIYDLISPEQKVENIVVGLPGRHNVENSVAAFAITLAMKISPELIKSGIASFKGAKRRFEYIINTNKIVFIDDYAHHPEELKACIQSVKEMYPGKKVLGIFQPHLFTRTRDFADDFARSLDLLDEVVLLEIYPARELPIEGVNSQMLLNKMKSNSKSLIKKEELLEQLKIKNADVILTVGAGDIDKLVNPIKEMLMV